MTFRFSKRSLTNLEGVHHDLVEVAHLALSISPIDFVIIDGVRTIEEQRILVAKGKSKTMDSRHLTGRYRRCRMDEWDNLLGLRAV